MKGLTPEILQAFWTVHPPRPAAAVAPIVRAATPGHRTTWKVLAGLTFVVLLVRACQTTDWSRYAIEAAEIALAVWLVLGVPIYLGFVRSSVRRLRLVATHSARLDGTVKRVHRVSIGGSLVHVVDLEIAAPGGDTWAGSFPASGPTVGHQAGDCMNVLADLREGGRLLAFSDRFGLSVGRVTGPLPDVASVSMFG